MAATIDDEARNLRNERGAVERYEDSNEIADQIDRLTTGSERADAVGDLRRTLGTDAAGSAAFGAVLVAAQTPRYQEAPENFKGRSDRMHEAFAEAIRSGTLSVKDVRPLIESQGTLSVENSAQLSSYFDHLPDAPSTAAFRQEVVMESAATARSLAVRSPEAAGQLYAQAANGLADMPWSERQSTVDKLDARQPNVTAIANGALGGYADRLVLSSAYHSQGLASESYRVDGLARLLHESSERVESAARAGGVDRPAIKMNSDLFKGATSYLAASGGSQQDIVLGTHDRETGVRSALSESLDKNAAQILAGSVLNNRVGGLSGDASERLRGFSRFQADAGVPGQDTTTLPAAQAALGKTVGRLEFGVINGKDAIAREFSCAFAPTDMGVESAARVMGGLISSTARGIQDSINIANIRGVDAAAAQKSGQNFGAGVATVVSIASVMQPEVAGAATLSSYAIDHADRSALSPSTVEHVGDHLDRLTRSIQDDLDRSAGKSTEPFISGYVASTMHNTDNTIVHENPLASSLSALESNIGSRTVLGHQR